MKFEVVVEISTRLIVETYDKTPDDAARAVSTKLAAAHPGSQVRVKQIDYNTTEGGESHWYPPL